MWKLLKFEFQQAETKFGSFGWKYELQGRFAFPFWKPGQLKMVCETVYNHKIESNSLYIQKNSDIEILETSRHA